ncbi:hypothetical protein INS49_015799 [Diaporthe citri]|uniref:uncharacterized protein n=1 Tax=Diaporthe citri TaxID=83186 RepID=UPI001C7F1F89|nr:uncharacterized protein INS49_015799 [Diaporthe citri]KAG6356411.1 hypothetical protein INS49_015799 [Diaporthe citri]
MPRTIEADESSSSSCSESELESTGDEYQDSSPDVETEDDDDDSEDAPVAGHSGHLLGFGTHLNTTNIAPQDDEAILEVEECMAEFEVNKSQAINPNSNEAYTSSDEDRLYGGGNRKPAERYRQSMRTFNEASYKRTRYSKGTLRLLQTCEDFWQMFCREVMQDRDWKACHRRLDFNTIYHFLEWYLNQIKSPNGRAKRPLSKFGSLITFWVIRSFGVGRAYNGGRVKVVDSSTGTTLPRGYGNECVGELHFGGNTVIRQYLGGLSPESFYKEDGFSWFKTGDQGRMATGGSIFMVGRYKDMIKRGGENIFPQQLEYTLQSVCRTKAQVIGIPDLITGEACVAVVDTSKSEHFSKLQLQLDVSKHIGPEFVFVHILTLEELGLSDYPLGPGGKVRKPVLKELVVEHLNKTKQPDALANGNARSTTKDQGKDYWIEFVKSVWADLLHIDSSQFDEDFRLEHFTDSLTAMRYCFEIERLTSKRLTVADVRDAPTIRTQAILVSGASVETYVAGKTDLDVQQDTGPPTLADVLVCRGKESKFKEIQELAKPVLEHLGLTWEHDVQECFGALPLWCATVLLPPTRTFNLRFAFEVRGLEFSEIREALINILKVQPMLVSTGVKVDNGLVYLELRPSDRVLSNVITREPEFGSVDSAVDYGLHEPSKLVPHPPEMLCRFGISPISGEDAGEGPVHVIIISQAHSVCDGMTNSVLISELETQVNLIRAKKAGDALPRHISPRFIPYKLFCEMYENLDYSTSAKYSRELIASRFHGVAKEAVTAWPSFDPTKIMSIFGGSDVSSSSTDICRGGILLQRSRRTPGILSLQDTHGIPPSVALKVAYGLAVMQMTGKKTARFLRVDAARHWPFQGAWTQSHLPNPLLVGGPTPVLAWERLRLGGGGGGATTLLDVFRRAQAEDAEVAPHTHVFNSHGAIIQHLPPEDAAFVRGARPFDPKIALNHVPDVGRFTGADGLRALKLRGISFFGTGVTPLQSGFDVGDRELCVIAGLVDETKWDDPEGEVGGFEETILRTLACIVKPENWDAPVVRFAEPIEE